LWFPNSATARDCVAKNNGQDGVSGGDVSTITGCTSRDNGGAGFVLGYGSAISGCTATANGQTGISVGMSCVVKDCAVRNCGNSGIAADSGSTISGCALVGNDGPAAIQVQAGCSVLNNTCFAQNDPEQDTAGIRAQSTGSRIEGNTVCSNWWGIVVEGTGNFVFRNTASANTSGNYSNAPGNVVGEILNVSSGATVTNASPWANFSY
jgi:parallel beta-helix repeat protein